MTNTTYSEMTKGEQKAHRAAMLRLAQTPMPKEQLDRLLGQRAATIPSKKVRRERSRSGRDRAAINRGMRGE